MAIAVFAAGAPASGNGLITEDVLNDLALAEKVFDLALADSADIFDTPVFRFADGSGAGTLTLRHRILTLGWGLSMSATAAEDTDVSASSVTAADNDTTIARRSLRLDMTGLAIAVGQAWGFDPVELGATMVGSFRAGRMDAAAAAVAAASTNVTSAGTGSIDDLYDIIDSITTSSGDPGMLLAFLHSFTAASIRDSLRAEVGPLQHRPDIQKFLQTGNFKEIAGILVAESNRVTNAAGKHENAVMAPYALGYAYAMPVRVGDGNVDVSAPTDMPLRIVIEPDASRDVLQIVANAYDGVSIRDQARIRGFLAAIS